MEVSGGGYCVLESHVVTGGVNSASKSTPVPQLQPQRDSTAAGVQLYFTPTVMIWHTAPTTASVPTVHTHTHTHMLKIHLQ